MSCLRQCAQSIHCTCIIREVSPLLLRACCSTSARRRRGELELLLDSHVTDIATGVCVDSARGRARGRAPGVPRRRYQLRVRLPADSGVSGHWQAHCHRRARSTGICDSIVADPIIFVRNILIFVAEHDCSRPFLRRGRDGLHLRTNLQSLVLLLYRQAAGCRPT